MVGNYIIDQALFWAKMERIRLRYYEIEVWPTLPRKSAGGRGATLEQVQQIFKTAEIYIRLRSDIGV